MSDTPYAFIIGCQRSGTSILFDVMSRHPDIAGWMEPFFIWDMKLALKSTDDRSAKEATPEISNFVRKEFELYKKKSKKKLVLEKSPENCFRIPFVNAIFPGAKYINIIRDGRDSTLSINKEWQKRAKQVNEFSIRMALDEIAVAMSEQPFWRNRIQEFWFEFKNLKPVSARVIMNKSRWEGYPGWGPRYKGWKDDIDSLDVVTFNAKQWVKSVEQVEKDRHLIPAENIIDISYEDFLRAPAHEIARLLNFLNLDSSHADKIAYGLRQDNTNKWQKAFTAEQQQEIISIQEHMLEKLGYSLPIKESA